MTDAPPPAAAPPPAPTGSTTGWEQDWLDAFVRCPMCLGRRLQGSAVGARCLDCQHTIAAVEAAILSNLPVAAPAPTQQDGRSATLSARVRQFYEQQPFPNYDGFESVGDLLARASRSVYAAMLDRQVPLGARILEVGCGTGQLGLFLSIGGRSVVGVDMTLASLRLASAFAAQHGLRDCKFVHASLFDLPLASESFDLVICKGVLHHTPDPAGGLRAILRLLRPGGYVICGVYNHLGRIPTTLRRWWFRLARGNPAAIDHVIGKMAKSDAKARSWYLDQYAHPLESRHSVDEVLRWFEDNQVEFVQSVPRLRLGEPLTANSSLFRPMSRSNRFGRWLAQASWMFTIGREGALFDMIGRKRPAAP